VLFGFASGVVVFCGRDTSRRRGAIVAPRTTRGRRSPLKAIHSISHYGFSDSRKNTDSSIGLMM
jgi:hypothetical protein